MRCCRMAKYLFGGYRGRLFSWWTDFSSCQWHVIGGHSHEGLLGTVQGVSGVGHGPGVTKAEFSEGP